MSDEIKPALTPDEWSVLEATDGYCLASRHTGRMVLAFRDGGYVTLARPDAVAALCLHAQPFGFTQKDVELLVLVAGMVTPPALLSFDSRDAWAVEMSQQLESLADRIEALIPPPPS